MANIAALDTLKQGLDQQFGAPGGGQPTPSLNNYMAPEAAPALDAGIPTPPPPGAEMGMGQPGMEQGMPDLGQVTLAELLSMGLTALMTGLAHMQPPGAMAPPMAPQEPPMAPPAGESLTASPPQNTI